MMEHETIPFLDLVAQHRELEAELLDVVRRAFSTAGFIGGHVVEDFETSFAQFCDTRYCVGVNSGTDALRFALIAAGIGCGDVIITVPNTFIATTEAISQAGALPEFVDIDEHTHNIDPLKLQAYLENHCSRDKANGPLISRRSGKRVAGIVPVHLYGQMADMDPILELAERHNLTVIEDACQAHGAEYFSTKRNRWCKAGSMGHAAAFSFYPGKNLGACGEAGAVTTNDEQLAHVCRQLRDHGQSHKYYHDLEGYNGRLDAIQAGFLTVKLRHVREWNAQRRHAAARYKALFETSGAEVITPYETSLSREVYHLYVIRCDNRDALRDALGAEGIGTGIHYPIPLHLQKAYGRLGYTRGDFPTSEAAAAQILSLPMFPTLSQVQQARVVTMVATLLNGHQFSAGAA